MWLLNRLSETWDLFQMCNPQHFIMGLFLSCCTLKQLSAGILCCWWYTRGHAKQRAAKRSCIHELWWLRHIIRMRAGFKRCSLQAENTHRFLKCVINTRWQLHHQGRIWNHSKCEILEEVPLLKWIPVATWKEIKSMNGWSGQKDSFSNEWAKTNLLVYEGITCNQSLSASACLTNVVAVWSDSNHIV